MTATLAIFTFYKGGSVVPLLGMIYDPVNSPLLVEPGYLLDGLTAAIHRPSLASVGMPPIWDTIVPVILAALSVITLWYATSRNRKQS